MTDVKDLNRLLSTISDKLGIVAIAQTRDKLSVSVSSGTLDVQQDFAILDGAEFQITILKKDLKSLLKAHIGDVRFNVTFNALNIKSTNLSNGMVFIRDSADLPKAPDNPFTLDGSLLRVALDRFVGVTAGSYDYSSILGAVNFEIQDGYAEITATDGSRLSYFKTAYPGTFRANVHAQVFNAFTRILSKRFKSVQLEVDSTRVLRATAEGITVNYRGGGLSSAEYPRYRELFPQQFTFEAEVPTALGNHAAEIQRLDDRKHLAVLRFQGLYDNVTISTTEANESKYSAQLPVKTNLLDDAEMSFAFNGRYLSEALKSNDKTVKVKANGPLKPVVFSDSLSGFKHMLMPVQVS